MEIGDRVRLLHGKEEGIIRRFIDQKTVEVEIEAGFLIPVLKNELVTIDRGETESFRREEHTPAKDKQVDKEFIPEDEKEIFIALETKNTLLELWLINHTGNNLLFTAHAVTPDQTRGLSYGTLKKFSYSKIDSWNLKDQDRWPLLIIDILPFLAKGKDPVQVISRKLTIKNSMLIKKKAKAPLLNQEAILISLTEIHKPVDPENLKKAFFEDKDAVKKSMNMPAPGRERIVDLHIESLVKDARGLDNEEILRIQTEYFEKKLDQALIDAVDVITFVHGIGNGTLRNRIHKFLSQYPHIRYFEDAQKGKFGYGATKVIFK